MSAPRLPHCLHPLAWTALLIATLTLLTGLRDSAPVYSFSLDADPAGPRSAPPLNAPAAPRRFTFTAAGDYGATAETTAVLQGIGRSGAAFNLALGDLTYGAKTEAEWCTYVRSLVGPELPFEVLVGNREDYNPDDGVGGTIDAIAACLPHRVGALSGQYGKEYYFDYPATAPLARFILVAPHITAEDGQVYTYTVGSAHYTWLANAIDSARAAGIRWVVVGMHKVCLSVGQQGCQIGPDLLNLLVEKRVDLVLQGHDHVYERSRQLAHSPACPQLRPNTYQAACVVDDGEDGAYPSGAGTVFLVVGTGGQGLHTVSDTDPEAPYFARWMGINRQPTPGFVRVTVSDTALDADYLGVAGAGFTDHFSLTAGPQTVTGRVTLQGRDDDSGTRIGSEAASTETAADGSFSLTLPPGAHVLTASQPGYLSAQTTVVVEAGPLTLPTGQLLAGDTDNNGHVDIADLVLIAAHYGAQPPGDPRADLDLSGRVDLMDLILVGGNFGQQAPRPWSP